MSLRHSIASLTRAVNPLLAARSTTASSSLCARVSHRAFTAETSESLSDLPEPETVGWGATKMSDMLQEKGPEAGAWLWVSRDDHVIDAVRKMTKANVGSLLVFDPSKIEEPKGTDKILHASREAVVGIFTERDYMTKIAVQGRSSRDTKISEVMTPNPITVTPKHSVLDVMELMINKNFRHVPVVDEGRLLGMASMRDVVHVMLKEHREEVGRLQEYIQGTF
ncbi:hypothetical protein ACKKBG_A23380 [Auxenochlorella protothecoides x Auxenochlorella symbiontica]|uniref:CBS domain-containing protein n=1 Tax=Auxenochlorella protothecoides TaxID=3075 RepID=A0A1D1ZNV7_AUXPR